MDYRQRQCFNVVADEANETEARHRALELYLELLLRQIFGGSHLQVFLGVERLVWPDGLSAWKFLAHFDQFHELAVAVVNQLNQRVIRCLTGGPMVQKNFKEVADRCFVVNLIASLTFAVYNLLPCIA